MRTNTLRYQAIALLITSVSLGLIACDDGNNSVTQINCGEGTELSEDGKTCVVSAGDHAGVEMAGEEALSCGEGTQLDEESNTCISITEPTTDRACGEGTLFDANSGLCIIDENSRVVNDTFNLGQFEIPEPDLPGELSSLLARDVTFNIKNTGDSAQDYAFIKVSLVPNVNSPAELEELRSSLAANEFNDDNPLVRYPLSSVLIENLEVGEIREVMMEFKVQPDLENGYYAYLFTVNEYSFIVDAQGNQVPDYNNPDFRDENVFESERLDNAASAYAPSTVLVGQPDKANINILSSYLTNNSFTIKSDPEDHFASGVIALNSQGLDYTGDVRITAELRLPGYSRNMAHINNLPEGAADDPAFLEFLGLDEIDESEGGEFIYNPNRVIPLRFRAENRINDQIFIRSECREGSDQCYSLKNDTREDISLAFTMTEEYKTLLLNTLNYPELNTDLDEFASIYGEIVIMVEGSEAEYQDNLEDNTVALPVVFMAPEQNLEDNIVLPIVEEVITNKEGTNAILNEHYGNSNNHIEFSAIAEAKASNFKLRGALVGHSSYFDANSDLRVFASTFNIISLGYELNLGITDENLFANVASQSAVAYFEVLDGDDSWHGWGKTLIDFEAASPCEEENDITTCDLFGEEDDEDAEPAEEPKSVTQSRSGTDSRVRNVINALKKIPFSGGIQKTKEFCDPLFHEICFRAKGEGTAGLALNFVAYLEFDESVPNKTDVSLNFGVGPSLSLEGSGEGSIDIFVGWARVRGEVEIFSATLIPLISVTTTFLTSIAECVTKIESSIGVFAEIVINFMTGRLYVDGRVFGSSFTINLLNFSFPAITKTLFSAALAGPSAGDGVNCLIMAPTRLNCQEMSCMGTQMKMRDTPSVVYGSRSDDLSPLRVIHQPTSECTDYWIEGYAGLENFTWNSVNTYDPAPLRRDFRLVSHYDVNNQRRIPLENFDQQPYGYGNNHPRSFNETTYYDAYEFQRFSDQLITNNEDPWGFFRAAIQRGLSLEEYARRYNLSYETQVPMFVAMVNVYAAIERLGIRVPYNSGDIDWEGVGNFSLTRIVDGIARAIHEVDYDAYLLPTSSPYRVPTSGTRVGCYGYCAARYHVRDPNRRPVIAEIIKNHNGSYASMRVTPYPVACRR